MELTLLVLALTHLIIAYRFYTYKNGELRILLIRFFGSSALSSLLGLANMLYFSEIIYYLLIASVILLGFTSIWLLGYMDKANKRIVIKNGNRNNIRHSK